MGWLANEKKLVKDHWPHTRGTLALGLQLVIAND